MAEKLATAQARSVGNVVIEIPGPGETQTLEDWCPNLCNEDDPASPPVAVIADPDGHGRTAAYRCQWCGHRWLCWWSMYVH